MKGIVVITALMIALLMVPGTAMAQGKAAIVVSSGAGLYELPAKSIGAKVEVAPKTAIRILDEKGTWYIVRAADLVGWMKKETIRIMRPTPTGSGCFYYHSGRKVFVERTACN
jgi:hypothetical protein